MNAAVGLTAGLGLDGDRCIRVIPRHRDTTTTTTMQVKIVNTTIEMAQTTSTDLTAIKTDSTIGDQSTNTNTTAISLDSK